MINSSCHTWCGSYPPTCPTPRYSHPVWSPPTLCPGCSGEPRTSRWHDTSKISLKGCDNHVGCSFELSLSLGSLSLREAAAMSRGHSDNLWKQPHGEELRTAKNGRNGRGVGFSSPREALRWPQPQLTAWRHPCRRTWVRTTQLSHFHIPDPQKLCGIIQFVL